MNEQRTLTRADIRAARAAGNSTWEVLAMVVAGGREYPDAVFAVSQALGLSRDDVEEMERDYDECC
jgi:hypothetical protein